MPIRVKNITDGYFDHTIGKFRPIRWADDYDPTRTDDSGSRSRAKKKVKAKKDKAKKAKAKKTSRKPASRRTASKRSASRKTAVRSRKPVRGKPARKVSRRKKAVKSMKNPIPSRFTTAKVRRLPGGDIQVLMLR